MNHLWISFACLAGLLSGIVIGRHAAAPSRNGLAGSAVPRGGPGTSANPAPPPDLLTALKKTSTMRGKTAIMLQALSSGRSQDMQQLVDASTGDFNQLSLLADIALHTNPAGFIKALSRSLPSDDYTGQLAWEFAGRWGKTDFAAAFETCRNLPTVTGASLGGTVLETQFAADPTAALKIAVAHPNLRFDWSNQHKIPATTENMDLIRALPPSMGKAAMIGAISANLPPDQAFALALEDRYSNPSYGIMRASTALVEKDPGAAREWVLANPGHPAATQLAASLSAHLIKTDPSAAVEWATSHLSGPRRTSTLEKAAEALSKTDPAAAAAARAQLPAAFKITGKP